MHRTTKLASLLCAIALMILAGCPTQTPTEFTIAGTWTGTLSCTSTESLSGTPQTPRTGARDLTITFDENGVPTGLPIWGFAGAETQTVEIARTGETATVTFTSGNLEITLVVTVTEASYSASQAHVVLDVQYSATGGSLTQQGTATVTIDATAAGDVLTVTITADYDVTQTAGPVTLETGETIVCTGTLARQ